MELERKVAEELNKKGYTEYIRPDNNTPFIPTIDRIPE